MSPSGPIPAPPSIHVEVVEEHPGPKQGFMWVRHVTLRNRHNDGTLSAPYDWFMVERTLLDAVAIMLYRRHEDGTVYVVLRSQLRPPMAFRKDYDVPLLAEGTGAVQWEVPAGLVELGEHGEAGLFQRASAEALEEVGLALVPERFRLLGQPASLSPGLIAEKLHFVCAELAPHEQPGQGTGDGHVVEAGSQSLLVPLSDALAALDAGLIHDVKTEVALNRLARSLGAV